MPRGRRRTSPHDIVGTVEDLKGKHWNKKEAIWELLSRRPEYKGMTPAAVEAAYYRDLERPSPAVGNMLAAAFALEDEREEGIRATPDDDLTRTCLQNWSDWMAVLVTAWPQQEAILSKNRSFWLRPVILSRYLFALRKSV
jgi:hypothetical protein